MPSPAEAAAPPAPSTAPHPARPPRTLDFGVMFFAGAEPDPAGGRYRLLLEAARLADRQGFNCIWTPERHFHPFGGLFPDPAVVGAALAMITSRLEIRAGSQISPLHDALRVAESWSVVDNLSGGRVAVSFGSGWNVTDFVLRPENYAQRQAVMYRQIEEVRALWRGGRVGRRNSYGRDEQLEIFPKPVQRELPVWVTSSGNLATFASAGRMGANVLTHLIGQDREQLAEKIRAYREARAAAGLPPGSGKVSLMLHTFLGESRATVEEKVRRPFRDYLRSAIGLEQLAALGGGAVSGGKRVDPHDIPAGVLEELLDIAFARYFETASLMGTVESCAKLAWQLHEEGVDEIACLIDFIDDAEAVLGSLGRVPELRAALARRRQRQLAPAVAVAAFSEEIEA